MQTNYNRFLRESAEQHPVDTASAFLKEHNPECLRDGQHPQAWRGVRSIKSDAWVQHPLPGGRRASSGNVTNHVQLFVTASTRWKDYPTRDIICSTDADMAAQYMNDDAYDDAFAVFSGKDAAWGVCPSSDFWTCFGVNKAERVAVYSVPNVAYALKTALGDAGVGREAAESLYAAAANVKTPFGGMKEPHGQPVIGMPGYAEHAEQAMLAHIHNKMRSLWLRHGGTLQEWVDDLLDPVANGFSLREYKDLPQAAPKDPYGFEVWTDTPCLLLQPKHIAAVRELLYT